MVEYKLDFEKPVVDLEQRIKGLKESSSDSLDLADEITRLEAKLESLRSEVYSKISYWDLIKLARHPKRPHSLDYIEKIVDQFHEISGDRAFGNDQSIITGFGELGDQKVAIIAIEKGRKTQEKIQRNFGMPNPEGYRKALRVGKLASRFQVPLITIIDTPGAYPGIEAEQRGQAQAIAQNLEEFFGFNCPIISVIIGEGGSGGALGIGIGDRVFMQEFSVYSVISPESCASILWSDATKGEQAAQSLKLGANKALELGVIDGIIKEPLGGAHRNFEKAAENLKSKIQQSLKTLSKLKIEKLKEQRFQKFRKMGNQTIEEVKSS